MSDVFRRVYKPLNAKQVEAIDTLKTLAAQLHDYFDTLIDTDAYCFKCHREIALAKINLEQSVMWATKGITE